MRPYDPTKEIELAVRTGFITKEIWNEFFAMGKLAWRNRVWMNFVERGFFRNHYSTLAKDVITPNPRHPLVIALAGDAVAQPPAVSVIEHDAIVVKTFFQLRNSGILLSAKFESELKREDLRDRRHYDPSDKTKYPDLLIQLNGPNSHAQIAIEIEKSRKEPKRYRQIMNSYMTKKSVSKIIFVTDLDVVKNGIRTAIRETYFPEWAKPVGFASLKQWRKNSIETLIEFSEMKTTLAEMSSVSNKTL